MGITQRLLQILSVPQRGQSQDARSVSQTMTMSERDRKSGQRDAIPASCLGAMPQVMANDSSVLIVFGGLPGAGETIEVMTAAPAQLATSLLMVPFAWLSEQTGKKAMILGAAFIGCVAFLITASAPWFGHFHPRETDERSWLKALAQDGIAA